MAKTLDPKNFMKLFGENIVRALLYCFLIKIYIWSSILKKKIPTDPKCFASITGNPTFFFGLNINISLIWQKSRWRKWTDTPYPGGPPPPDNLLKFNFFLKKCNLTLKRALFSWRRPFKFFFFFNFLGNLFFPAGEGPSIFYFYSHQPHPTSLMVVP